VHELPLVTNILELSLRYAEANGVSRIISIKLRVGALCDAKDEWLRRYFMLTSRGTKAEGAVLELSTDPAIARCGACGKEFELSINPPQRPACPSCGGAECAVVSGFDYFIESMEAI
jgi:hydrogenase nickel incorporation protein HypA/HybF